MKKISLILILCLVTLIIVKGQEQRAEKLLSKAVYEEEVTGELDKAIKAYQLIIKQYPNNRKVSAEALLHLGICYEKLGLSQASENYRAVINKYPDQSGTVKIANERLSRLDNFKSEATAKAEQSFKQATDLYKEFKYESAIQEYEKVIKLAPESRLAQESRLWIGQCYFKEGKYDLALASFKTLIKEFPQSTIVPVAELMIYQTRQSIEKDSNKKDIISLDEKTILDPNTGIRYTKVYSLAGTMDQITTESIIANIAPNRKFLLADNKIFPFDNTDPVNLSDDSSQFWMCSRLAPDATKIAYLTKKGVSVLPVSPETGSPMGPGNLLVSKENIYWPNALNWSPDGNNLVFTLHEEPSTFAGLWTVSLKDGSTKQVSSSFFNSARSEPVFSKTGSNILYKHSIGGPNMSIRMLSSSTRRSVTILDSCRIGGNFSLSPDNQWILYDKKQYDDPYLVRIADKQKKEISPPEEVGSLVSWADKGSKAFFYNTSYENHYLPKIVSIYGGPAFELNNQLNQEIVGWSPGSENLLVSGEDKDGNKCLQMTNLYTQNTKVIAGTIDYGYYPSFSPDCSKVIVMLTRFGETDLMILPLSLKEGKVTGKPILLYENFAGYKSDYAWSPDGKKIAVTTVGEVWICNAEGGDPLQLTKTAREERFPSWSSDGKTICVGSLRSKYPPQIISALNGEVLKTFDGAYFSAPTPFNSELIIAYDDGQLSSVSLTTGEIRKITNWKELTPDIYDLQLSPDGKWIAINGLNLNDDPYFKIFMVNYASGNTYELTAEDPLNKEDMLWSPDSKWIAYYSYGSDKTGIAGTLWEADLSDFMKSMKPGTETGYTTETDIDELVTKFPEGKPDGSFTDARDGRVYKYKKIGKQTWMAENLAWLPEVSPASTSSTKVKHYYVYDYNGTDIIAAKNTENYQKYGVLYNGSAAEGSACPTGWYLPNDVEWMTLEQTLGMDTSDLKRTVGRRSSGDVGNKLKSRNWWKNDDIFIGTSGFNARPGGYYKSTNNSFSTINRTAMFWTSSSKNDTNMGLRVINPITSITRNPSIRTNYAFSIRCVKDR